MKHTILSLAIVIALGGCAAMSEPQATRPTTPTAAAADNSAALQGVREMKIAFDFTEGNPVSMIRKLEAVEQTRKQLIAAGVTPKMMLAFRGPASFYTQLDLSKIKEAERADALKVRALIREFATSGAVESIEQCNLPLEQMKLKAADLMPEVKLVGNGWISLVAYQQRGYGYIAP